MQILQDQPVKGSLQDALGSGLQQLAHLKMQQLHQRHQQKQTVPGLAAGLKIPKATAEQLSLLPPELQSVVIKGFIQSSENSALSEALSSIGGNQFQPQGDQQAPLQAGQAMGGGEPSALEPMGGAQAQAPQPKGFADVLKNPRLKPEHRLRIAEMQQRNDIAAKKLSATERREAHKEELAIDKQYRPFISETHAGYKGVIDDSRRLDRMETLVKQGKLAGPKVAAGLDFLEKGATIFLPHVGGVHLAGLNFKSAMSPESAEFEKLSNDFVKNAKSIFGARITDNDLKSFMSTVPTLMMNDEGKLRVIHNMRLYNDAIKARYDAMRSILDKNNGRAPRNFDLLVEDAAAPKLDEIAKKFALGVPEEPKMSNKIGSGFFKLDNPMALFRG